MNPWETSLRCWTPRGPGRRVERRLFGRRQPSALPRLATALIPAIGCLLLTLAGLPQLDSAPLGSKHRQAALIATCLSNQSFAPYLAGNPQSAANRWDSFEWTNRGDSRSSMLRFTPVKPFDLQ